MQTPPAFTIVRLVLRTCFCVCVLFVWFSFVTQFLAPGSLSVNVYKLTKLVKGTQGYWHRDKISAD